MRLLVCSLILVFIICINAKTYYFDNIVGDDSRSLEQATSPNTPWKSLQKFSAIQGSLISGDYVLFRRGQRWNGQMNISAEGTQVRPIVVSSYGPESDPLPIISGAIPLTTWTKMDDYNGLPLYYTNVSLPADGAVVPSSLFVNQQRMTLARSPNKGEWYRITGLNRSSSEVKVIDTLRNEPDGYWTGSTIRVRTSSFSCESKKVSVFANSTFQVSKFLYLSQIGYGYFIEGKMELIDKPGEWFYDNTTGRLYLSPLDGKDPSNHQVDAVVYPNVILVTGTPSHIIVTKLQLLYSVRDLVYVKNYPCYGLVFDQNIVRFAGQSAFQLDGAVSAIVRHCNISNIEGIGVNIGDGEGSSVLENRITDIGLELCYGNGGGGIYVGQYGSKQSIIGNFLNNIGYVGIHCGNNGALVDGNFVNNSLVSFSGGGAIYAFGDWSKNLIITNNIVTHIYGGVEGMPIGSKPEGYGIVAADKVGPGLYENNTVAFCRSGGFQINYSHDIHLKHNLFFGSGAQITMFWRPGYTVNNITVESNTLVTMKSGQVLVQEPFGNKTDLTAEYYNNFYCDPFSSETFMASGIYYNFEDWINRPGVPNNDSRICSLKLKDYQVDREIISHVFKNGDFEDRSSIDGWSSVPDQSLSLETGIGGFNGSCLLLRVTNGTQATTSTFDSSSEKMLEVSFQAKSSVRRVITFPLKVASGSHLGALNVPALIVTDQIEEYSLLIEKNSSDANQVTLTIVISDTLGGEFYMDNLVIKAVKATFVNPLQLFYNTKVIEQIIVLAPGDEYVDLEGKLVYGTFVLPPLTSKVLLYQGFNSSLIPTEDVTKPESTNSNHKLPIIIGCAVGVFLLLLIALLISLFLWRTRKDNNKDSNNPKEESHLSIEMVGKGAWAGYETLPSVNHSAAQLESAYTSIGSISSLTTSPKVPKKGIDRKNDWLVDYSELQIEYEIGRGAYGIVYKARWRETPVAVKKMIMENMTQKNIDDFYRETVLMKSLRPSPNVATLIGVCENPVGLITEFYEHGSLHALLLSSTEITPPIYKKIILGMARGMLHLHMESIVHRDLAARNVLLGANYEPKISDFGLSRVADNDGGKTESNVGPLLWMAPESLQKHAYSTASDVWSFGITLIELFTRANPYQELKISQIDIASRVMRGKLIPAIPHITPTPIAEIMDACFRYSPSDRPNFKTICNKLEKELVV